MASEFKENIHHNIFNNSNILSYLSDYLDDTNKFNYIKAISGSNKIKNKCISFNLVVDKYSKITKILNNYKFKIKN